jgi:methyl-accepting chemotaxis protein
MNWIRNLRFLTKISAIVVALTVPVVLLTYFFVQNVQGDVDFAERELGGLTAYHELEEMLLPLADHEVAVVATLLGSPESARADAARSAVDAVAAQLSATRADFGASAGEFERRAGEINAAWQRARVARNGGVDDVVRTHDELRAMLRAMRDWIATTSYITLDPDAVTYYVLDTAVMRVPDLEALLGRWRASLTVLTGQAERTPTSIEDITEVATRLRVVSEAIQGNIDAMASGGVEGEKLQPAARQAYDKLGKALEQFAELSEKQLLGGPGRATPADVVLASATFSASIGEMHALFHGAAESQLQARITQLTDQRNTVLTIVAVAFALGMLFTVLVVRTTVMRLRANVSAVTCMAAGDYAQPETSDSSSDELGQLSEAVHNMREKVSAVLREVQESSATVSTAAREINDATNDLASRTEQQAASLEETASSMEEMTSTVKQNAENASVADKLAQTARQQAEQGGRVAAQAVEAMSSIEDASRKIGDIIAVIDEIAFQTNLLALNAAVEAARAGDQGRGFAVVASEVRSLAQRSATAAREIKTLIQDSVARVGQGGRLVSESGTHLSEIVTSVKKVSDIIGEISAASREQADGIEEINRAVTQMDEGTQQNAAMVEEATAAAASMREQADKLATLTAFFKLAARAAIDGVLAATPRVSSGAPTPARAPLNERRAATRPWNPKRATAAPPASSASAAGADSDSVAAVRSRATANGGDDWEQF